MVKGGKGLRVGPKYTSKGLAQRSSLIPILFNVYTLSIGVKIIQYAGDLIIYNEGNNITEVVDRINRQLKYCRMVGAPRAISCRKQIEDNLISGYKKTDYSYAPDEYNAKGFSWTDHTIYLRINLTNKMTWNIQIERGIYKAREGINIMKAVAGVWWEADPKTLLMVYKERLDLIWSSEEFFRHNETRIYY